MLQGKTCEDSLLSGEGRSLGAKISGGRGCPWGIFFGFYKTRNILLSDSANCKVLRVVVLTQYRRLTEGRTDRRNCHSQYSACYASIAAHCKNQTFVDRILHAVACSTVTITNLYSQLRFADWHFHCQISPIWCFSK